MGFKMNSSAAQQGNGLKPEGVYECLITSAEERTTKNGATGLNLSLVIRNDVEQKFKNGYIFHTLWKRREPTAEDMQVGGYGFGQVMALGKAAGLTDGKEYAGLEDFLADLMKRPVRVTLKHEKYNGKLYERVDYLDQTAFKEVRHIMKKPSVNSQYQAPPATQYAAQAAQTVQAAQFKQLPLDDDLPF